MTLTEQELDRIVKTACRKSGLSAAHRRLIHHFSNAVYHLPRENAVARITTGQDSTSRIRLTVRVVEQLLDRGVPAARPLPDAEVVEVDGATVSFWRYYDQQEDGRPLTAGHLGAVLRDLHKADVEVAGLPAWTPLESLREALMDDQVSRPLSPSERSWLVDTVEQTAQELGQMSYPLGVGLIHGDAWLGNLLRGDDGTVLLCDWDWTCTGPREIDLIPTWHATWRYGMDSDRPKYFSAEYGYDLEDWDGLPVLLRMRDLVQVTGPLRRAADSKRHAQALRQRLNGIRNEAHVLWESF